MSPLARFLHLSGGSGDVSFGEDGGMTIQVFLTSVKRYFFLPNAMVPGPVLQLWVLGVGMVPNQEFVTILLKLYVRIPKSLVTWILPSPHPSKLGLTVSAVLSPSSQHSH